MKKGFFLVVLMIGLALAVAPIALANETITVFNWFDYIDEDALRDFTDETGISVKYTNFTTNEEMYAKIASGAGRYDVIFPSDYIIERMIREDRLEKLNLENMPNVAGLIDWMKKPDYDPTGEYSVAYMWGTVGILYNPELVEEPVTSWGALFDPANRKNVFMMDSMRDTIGSTLKMLGYPINTHEEAELNQVRDALIQQKQDGIVKGYLVDETKDKMVAGEAGLALMWSGDALYSMMENETLEYVVPDEGSNVWVDGMCIPKGSEHKEAAEKFIDFMCRPDIAMRNMEYIYYSTPIQQVVDEMDEELKQNETLNPPQDVIDRCEFFLDVSPYMELYNKIWMEIRN